MTAVISPTAGSSSFSIQHGSNVLK